MFVICGWGLDYLVMVWQCVCAVFILWTSLREGLSCKSRDVQEIVKELYLEDVEDWEALAGWLGVNAKLIRENCATSTALGQCYRRKLVETYCYQRGVDPERVKEDIRHVLESKMRIKKQDSSKPYTVTDYLPSPAIMTAVVCLVTLVLIAVWKCRPAVAQLPRHSQLSGRLNIDRDFIRVCELLSNLKKEELRAVGRRLGLSNNTVNNYYDNSVNSYCEEIITAWMNERDSVLSNGGATSENLKTALESEGLTGHAAQI